MAALEATLAGPQAPVLAALAATAGTLAGRARRLAAALAEAGIDAKATGSEAAVGGGGAPGVALPSAAVSVPADLAVALRSSARVAAGKLPAVAGRVIDGRLLLDLYAVEPADDDTLAAAVLAAAEHPGQLAPERAG